MTTPSLGGAVLHLAMRALARHPLRSNGLLKRQRSVPLTLAIAHLSTCRRIRLLALDVWNMSKVLACGLNLEGSTRNFGFCYRHNDLVHNFSNSTNLPAHTPTQSPKNDHTSSLNLSNKNDTGKRTKSHTIHPNAAYNAVQGVLDSYRNTKRECI